MPDGDSYRWGDARITWEEPQVNWSGFNVSHPETAQRLNPSRSNILVPQGNLLNRRRRKRG